MAGQRKKQEEQGMQKRVRRAAEARALASVDRQEGRGGAAAFVAAELAAKWPSLVLL